MVIIKYKQIKPAPICGLAQAGAGKVKKGTTVYMEIEKTILQVGAVDFTEQAKQHRDLIRTAKQIHDELGENSILLDKFILRALEALNKVSVSDTVNDVFHDISKELRDLVKYIREGNGKYSAHPFYPTLKDYISKHPCPTESIYIDYYCARMFLEYSEFAAKRCMENWEKNTRAAAEEINTLKASLMELVDPGALEHLCELINKCFLYISPQKIFFQCLTDQYVLNCLTQLNGSGYVFQYLLNNDPQ